MKIEKFNVKELSLTEQTDVNGGFFGLDDLIIGLIIVAATAVVSDWDNFKRGLAGKPEIVNN